MFSYGLGTIPELHYYDVALIFVALMVAFIVVVMWLPETPRWLILKGNDPEQARAVLRCFRGPDNTQKIAEELGIIRSNISKGKLNIRKVLYLMFCCKATLVPFLTALFVCTYHQLSGIGVVTAYTGYILQEAGVPNPRLTSFYTAGLGLFIARIGAGVLVELIGRKSLLAVSSAGMCVSQIILGIQFYLMRSSLCDHLESSMVCNPHLYPIAISGVLLCAISFGIGAGPVTWILLSEYLPLEIKGVAGGICVLSNRITAVILIGTFVSYSNWAGPWYPWWTLASFNLIGFVIILLFVVETKGKTLEEVQELFQKKVIQLPCWK